MLGFFMFLGITLITFSVLIFVFGKRFRSQSKINVSYDQFGNRKEETANSGFSFLDKFTNKVLLIMLLVGFLLITLRGMFFYAEPGVKYFLQYPWGTQTVVDRAGANIKMFGTLRPWKEYMTIKTSTKISRGEKTVSVVSSESNSSSGTMAPIEIRFIDQVTAEVIASTRFKLPTDEESFMNLVKEFRTQENLIEATLMPTVREVISNTGYMFAAQDYISGSSSDFRYAVKDQLMNGMYSVEKLEIRDTVNSEISEEDRSIKEIKTSYIVVKRLDSDGKPIRVPHDITKSGIITTQAIIDDILLEPAFKKRLENQRDESAKRQLEQQKIKTAKDQQQRIVAEGERDKAQIRVEQEKEQVKQLISIETKEKAEKTNRDLAEIQLETARLQAQSRKVKADAEAYEKKKLAMADNSLELRLKYQLEQMKVLATAMQGQAIVPQTYIGNGGQVPTALDNLVNLMSVDQIKKKGNNSFSE